MDHVSSRPAKGGPNLVVTGRAGGGDFHGAVPWRRDRLDAVQLVIRAPATMKALRHRW
jgi:hypothetical protein